MSRRKSHRNSSLKSNTSYQMWRDVIKRPPIARQRLPTLVHVPDLTVYEDRRTNYPDRNRPAFAQPRFANSLVIGHPNVNVHTRRHTNNFVSGGVHTVGRDPLQEFPSARVAFAVPKSVAVCVRRHRRREVLHALGIAGGKGIGRNRKQHRNEWSETGC